jgi:hypothetical protein
MSDEIDPLEVAKVFLPIPDESYHIGLTILCLIVPIIVSMFFVIQDVYTIVSSNPAYSTGNFQYFVTNTYYLVVGAMACSIVNMLYALRKRPEKADVKNIGFWFTLTTLCLFALLGCRLSLLISMISLTGSDSIIDLNPSDVVYVKTKLEYLTLSIVVCFLLSFSSFLLINGEQMIEIATSLKKLAAAAKADMAGGD